VKARLIPEDMIVVTGAAGFTGSGLVGKLNNRGISQVLLVDDFSWQVTIQAVSSLRI